jgi:small-conductance mechanosensitive channel
MRNRVLASEDRPAPAERRLPRRLPGLASALLSAALAWGQAPQPTAPQQAAPQPAAPQQAAPTQGAPQANAQPAALDSASVLRQLNMAVNWYRRTTGDIQALGLPSEVIYQDDAQALAARVVRLAFQSARSAAELIKAQDEAKSAAGDQQQAQRRAEAEARVAARLQALQDQAATLETSRAKATGARRNELELELTRVKGAQDLQQALMEAIQKMKAFAETNGEATAGLSANIDNLARSLPEVLGQEGPDSAPAKPAGAASARPVFSASGGLVSQLAALYACVNLERDLDNALQRTDRLRALADGARAPLRAALRATIQEGQTLADRPMPADGDTESLMADINTQRGLTGRFKLLSGALMPLSQEVTLLDDSKANLGRWRDLAQRASSYVLKAVLIRVAVILAALAAILGLSEAWRRVTFRYVKEARRRRQFLVLRRVVTGFLMAIALVLGFVTEFSSLATFAGFITAGIAVGLQAVLLSVAAYFLIIGRYGIRVGDRVTIAGITGDVVDVGLVRLYLMELAGTGLDFRPTGRIAVFSNSVLFQAGTPLFRQIPGTEYSWHEVVVPVAPTCNHRAVQDKLLAAVEQVHQAHKPELERQHEDVERRVDLKLEPPRPESRLQFGDGGLELLVRYPVALRKAKELDELIAERILDLVGSDPDLKAAVTATPKIRSLVKS